MKTNTKTELKGNLYLLCVVFGIFVLVPSYLSAQEIAYKRYVMESGIVEYKISGSQNGTETLYFEEYGMKEAKYTDVTIDMFGMKQINKQVVYLDGYWQYTVNPDNNTGTKREDEMLKQLVESSEDQDLNEVGMKMFVSMGGEKIGTEQFQEKNCEVWQLESMGTKIWLWNFIPLKTEIDMMGMKITYEAVSFYFDKNIPDDKINIPDNIEFKEFDMNNLQDMMNSR